MKIGKSFIKLIKLIKFVCLLIVLFAALFLVGCNEKNNEMKNDQHVDNLFNEIKETV